MSAASADIGVASDTASSAPPAAGITEGATADACEGYAASNLTFAAFSSGNDEVPAEDQPRDINSPPPAADVEGLSRHPPVMSGDSHLPIAEDMT